MKKTFLIYFLLFNFFNTILLLANEKNHQETVLVDEFKRPDSLFHGEMWEGLNPGFWKIEKNALRRRLTNFGDRPVVTGFPFHKRKMKIKYDPSLDYGFLWRRDWKLSGNYKIEVQFMLHTWEDSFPKRTDDSSNWKMYQENYGFMGICLGGENLFENGAAQKQNRHISSLIGIKGHKEFSFIKHDKKSSYLTKSAFPKKDIPLKKIITLTVDVKRNEKNDYQVSGKISWGKKKYKILATSVSKDFVEGYFGIVCRGLVDFEVKQVSITPYNNKLLNVKMNECVGSYALGDTLKKVDNKWQCRFVNIFRNNGKKVDIRISDQKNPPKGWKNVPIAGTGTIVNNNFSRNTSIIDATLPKDPSEKTLYYTVWKDEKNVTADSRIGTSAVGSGTGYPSTVPTSGDYIGRLPQLKAPYKLCGLSCHAVSDRYSSRNGKWKGTKFFENNFVYDQPTPNAYKNIEAYEFQVMLWDDDIWYTEFLQYPPSVDDVYKNIEITGFGPTGRWKMMRHWNIMNPGDHDHGQDDYKGPEQIILRNHHNLGQDPDYLARNSQTIDLLMLGNTKPTLRGNPKRWRKWKMPNGDFTLVICDARLWRTSQDTSIWINEGWGHKKYLYSRKDPTRVLLGEEQFAWLQNIIKTDTSPLICLTGINALHTIWSSGFTGKDKGEENRIAADYAGWVKAGSDRVIELLGSRSGVTTVYGDVHVGSIIFNQKHRFLEASFGPIGRYGGRGLFPWTKREMKDLDQREIYFHALYHQNYQSPEDISKKRSPSPKYWNFLEMEFNPSLNIPRTTLKIRNLIDSPEITPRGDGMGNKSLLETGRELISQFPKNFKTIPNADVYFYFDDGTPITATKSKNDGTLLIKGIIDIPANTTIRMVSINTKENQIKIFKTK